MIVNELRIGNLIQVNPRENQIGLLSIQEIQKETIVGEMIRPKPGYHFRIKFDEIISIPLTKEWLRRAGYTQENASDTVWKDHRGLIDLYINLDEKKILYNGILVGKTIDTVHLLQNAYFFLTNQELNIIY